MKLILLRAEVAGLKSKLDEEELTKTNETWECAAEAGLQNAWRSAGVSVEEFCKDAENEGFPAARENQRDLVCAAWP